MWNAPARFGNAYIGRRLAIIDRYQLCVKIRKMDKDDLDEQEALLETYMRALGMRRGGRAAAE